MNGRAFLLGALGLFGLALLAWGAWQAFQGGPRSLVIEEAGAAEESHPEATGEQPLAVGFHNPQPDQVIRGREVFVWAMLHATERSAAFELVPPDGTRAPNRGHIDLILDPGPEFELTPDRPREGPGIFHSPDGFYTLNDVPPGRHTLVAVLVDGAHYPIKGELGLPIKATVRFTTQAQK